MAKCKFCGNEIFWVKQGRKNKPFDNDGSDHACDEMINSRSSLRTITRSSLTPEEIAKYESSINTKK